ncbi:farnesyl cysteine-carboxyl methyltransferase [Pestalotiopsis sp. IQ-011]
MDHGSGPKGRYLNFYSATQASPVNNCTAVHWHGVRMWDNVQNDGVPDITQCSIAPGDTLSYKFRATQNGTSQSQTHFLLQYSECLFGAIVLNGPAAADYDVDLGPLILQDSSHTPIFTAWAKLQEWGITHLFNNLLVNGTNTFDCSNVDDANCLGDGKKFQLSLEPGKKHLLRLVNVAADSQFRFNIDGHSLQVIASEFVPIKPCNADVITISSGQRYDIVIEANAAPGNYWMRGGWVSSKYCFGVANEHPEDMTGIVRYDAADTRLPLSTTATPPPETCADEPKESLIPCMSVNVSNLTEMFVEDFNVRLNHKGMFKWKNISNAAAANKTDFTSVRDIYKRSIMSPDEVDFDRLGDTY